MEFRKTVRMAKAQPAVLEANGLEVTITNPDKVMFPQAGHTKLDIAKYYLAVAAGALRGAGDRPNVLVRYPNGVGGEFFYQKRTPDSRPPWLEVVTISFPSGRTAAEIVPRGAAASSSTTTRTPRIGRLPQPGRSGRLLTPEFRCHSTGTRWLTATRRRSR